VTHTLVMDRISYLTNQLEVHFTTSNTKEPVLVDSPSKKWVCGLSLVGSADSDPAGSIDVCFLWLLCVFSGRGPTEFGGSSWVWSRNLEDEEAYAHSGCRYMKKGQRIPVVLRSKAYFCGHSIAGIAGSNPADSMDVRLMCLLCFVYIAASATSRSLFQKSPPECVYL
jgi:hypothetical protein